MRTFSIALLCLVLWGCSEGSKVSVQTHQPPAAWKGIYLLAPDQIEAKQGKVYSQVFFLGTMYTHPALADLTGAQIMGVDKNLPNWGWAATADAVPDEGLGFRLRCKSVFIYKTDGKPRIVYHQLRGEAGKYHSEDAAEKETADQIRDTSSPLESVIPKAFRRCEDSYVAFTPTVKAGGDIVLAADDLRFQSEDVEEYRALVHRLPVVPGELKAFKGIPTGFSKAGDGIFESPSNSYLPMPHTQRYYRTRTWVPESRSDGSWVLKGTVPARPALKTAKNGYETNEYLYNLLERGEWVEPTPLEARLYSTENGVRTDLGRASLSSDGLELGLGTLGQAGLQTEVDYAIPGDEAHFIVQTLAVSRDGKLVSVKAELRQK